MKGDSEACVINEKVLRVEIVETVQVGGVSIKWPVFTLRRHALIGQVVEKTTR